MNAAMVFYANETRKYGFRAVVLYPMGGNIFRSYLNKYRGDDPDTESLVYEARSVLSKDAPNFSISNTHIVVTKVSQYKLDDLMGVAF